MLDTARLTLDLGETAGAVMVTAVWILLASALREPSRVSSHAVIVGVAAGAYLNGGFGRIEFVFAMVCGYFAYRSVKALAIPPVAYRWIGGAWLLHTAWDLAHHLAGMPMISWVPASSINCAVTDTLLALWFFLGAPGVYGVLARRRPAPADDRPVALPESAGGAG